MVKRRVRFALWWRRSGMGLRTAVFGLAALVFALLVYWRHPQEEGSGRVSLLVYTLVHLNIVLLCVLAFLIGRNVVKLIFDRRRRILGSRLRSRLVVAFVGLTLVPTVILFVLASGLLTRAMEGWFSSQVESAANGAVDVARQHYSWMTEYTRRIAKRLSTEISASAGLQKDPTVLASYLEKQRAEWGVFTISIFDNELRPVVEVHNAAAVISDFREPPPDQNAVERALHSEGQVLKEEQASSQFVRAYLPLTLNKKPGAIMLTVRISPDLVQSLNQVNDSYLQYEQLKFYKRPIKTSYILTLSMITGLLLFSAIWIAFYIARELSVPIQRLAEATRSVARGRYDIQIREHRNDELGFLVKSFNQMTSDLRLSRQESERRRIYIETILANLAVAVISIDTDSKVSSVNAAAAQTFDIGDPQGVIGTPIATVLTPEVHEQIAPLLEAFTGSEDEPPQSSALILERQIEITVKGRQIKLLYTAGQLRDIDDHVVGFVLLFDDITELTKAQHLLAWREVAQRIAHEIKNPLTPVRLSAQRMAKLVSEDGATSETRARLVECSQTIVEHVDSIKRLADEFSHFARMPRAEFAPGNLNPVISDTLAPFIENHPEITFQFLPDLHMPSIQMDKEQVRRIVMNLLSNAIAALRDNPNPEGDAKRIAMRTHYDRRRKMVSFEVADNGPGIGASDKTRIFEPYFTTKKGGTGLGLAIVTSIVSDHQGEIHVYDNNPRGAKFTVELPLSPLKTTQRRFSSVA